MRGDVILPIKTKIGTESSQKITSSSQSLPNLGSKIQKVELFLKILFNIIFTIL